MLDIHGHIAAGRSSLSSTQVQQPGTAAFTLLQSPQLQSRFAQPEDPQFDTSSPYPFASNKCTDISGIWELRDSPPFANAPLARSR